MAETIKVGDQVLVNKKYRAVVRFIGPTAFKSGIWYGECERISLPRAIAARSGTVELMIDLLTADRPGKVGRWAQTETPLRFSERAPF